MTKLDYSDDMGSSIIQTLSSMYYLDSVTWGRNPTCSRLRCCELSLYDFPSVPGRCCRHGQCSLQQSTKIKSLNYVNHGQCITTTTVYSWLSQDNAVLNDIDVDITCSWKTSYLFVPPRHWTSRSLWPDHHFPPLPYLHSHICLEVEYSKRQDYSTL